MCPHSHLWVIDSQKHLPASNEGRKEDLEDYVREVISFTLLCLIYLLL